MCEYEKMGFPFLNPMTAAWYMRAETKRGIKEEVTQ